ncbi:hypothetical protein BC628DRAFT_246364 [Trametes gibbosa]|nr:hypothetical protein BC628DRAFT_246364 [Trametes gibbosa]
MQTSGCIGWVASIYDARNPSHSCAHLRRWDLQLRSLAAAYPDPEDAIFSFVGDDLVHLSLRDWPRAYYPMRGYVMLRFVAPILSASECLHILTRMHTPRLQSLEIVYR